MKKVKVHAHCSVCGWWIVYDLDVNEHGFFALHDAYCPDCLFMLIQDIKKSDLGENNGR
jgi:hypothetical protein